MIIITFSIDSLLTTSVTTLSSAATKTRTKKWLRENTNTSSICVETSLILVSTNSAVLLSISDVIFTLI